VKIPEGRELVGQLLVSLFVFVVCGIVLFIAIGMNSAAVQLAAVISVLVLVFLIGLRVGGKKPGD
jgi:hypothetical protein